MSASLCSACGYPLRADLLVCTQCGTPTASSDASQPAEITGPAATPVHYEAGGTPAVAPVVTGQVVPFTPPAPAAPAAHLSPVPAAPPPPTPAAQAEFVQATYEQISATPYAPPSQKNQTRRMILVGVTALLLTLIARIAISAATHEPEPEGEIVAQLPVGPEGGKAEFDDGGKIKVPKGAVDRPQTITVRRTVVRERIRAMSPSGTSIVIPAGAQNVYIFGPTSLVFLRPVTIVLPAPAPPNQGIVFISANGQITFVQSRTSGGSIVVRVNSFNFNQGQSVFVT